MYDHIVLGLKDLARSLRISRVRRLSQKEIELIEQASVKFAATLRSLEDRRLSNQLLQKQLDQLKEHIPANTMALLLGEPETDHVEDVD